MVRGRVAVVLVLLVAINIAWTAVRGFTGPILGALGYGVIVVVLLRWDDLRAVLIGCGVGTVWHAIELAHLGRGGPLSDCAFLIANVGLAVMAFLIAAFAIRTNRAMKKRG